MLDRYSTYLLNIRNNLIQCGVEVPVKDIKDYFDVCALEEELSDVLWFYKILAVSGSEYALHDFFLPLNGYFKERMRSIYYQEFLDFLSDYKTIGVEELRSKYLLEGGDAYDFKDDTQDEKVEADEDDVGFEEDDLFGYTDDPEEEEEPSNLQEGQQEKQEDNQQEDTLNSEDVDSDSPFGNDTIAVDSPNSPYVSHGVYLEDLYQEDDESTPSEDPENTEEDDIFSFDEDDRGEEGNIGDSDSFNFDEDTGDSSSFDLNEDIEDSNPSNFDEDSSNEDIEDSNPSNFNEDSPYVPHGVYLEDLLEQPDEEEDEDEESSDEVEDYSNFDDWDEDPEDESWNEEEDEDDEDGYFDFEEDSSDEDDGFEFEESSSDSDEDDDWYPEPSQETGTMGSKSVDKPVIPERDLSDALQDFINGSLTSARNSIRGLKNRKK